MYQPGKGKYFSNRAEFRQSNIVKIEEKENLRRQGAHIKNTVKGLSMERKVEERAITSRGKKEAVREILYPLENDRFPNIGECDWG